VLGIFGPAKYPWKYRIDCRA